MSPAPQPDSNSQVIRETAACWTVRRERGLSAAEAVEFESWLAADSRHREALRQARTVWALLDRAPEATAERELALARKQRIRGRRRLALRGLAAAAVLAVGGFVGRTLFEREARRPPPASALVAAGPRIVTLADGTLVKLNAGGKVIEDFDAAERRVRLTRGEAHFTVVRSPARPFVVIAGTLQVRAVGTAFNVNVQASQVEVLVTEGRVVLTRETSVPSQEPELGAGERAVVPKAAPTNAGASAPPPIVVTRVDAAEITRALAWQQSLVRLGGATLAELADEFERRFHQRVILADPEIAQLRAGGRVRGDDAEGFANLLARTFDLEVERGPDGAWVWRKKKAAPNSGR